MLLNLSYEHIMMSRVHLFYWPRHVLILFSLDDLQNDTKSIMVHLSLWSTTNHLMKEWRITCMLITGTCVAYLIFGKKSMASYSFFFFWNFVVIFVYFSQFCRITCSIVIFIFSSTFQFYVTSLANKIFFVTSLANITRSSSYLCSINLAFLSHLSTQINLWKNKFKSEW